MSARGLDYGGIGELVAACSVLSPGGAVSGASLGIASVSAPAASVYTVTLSNQIDPENAVVIVQNHGAVVGTASANHASDSIIVVSTFGAAEAAADRDFTLEVWRKAVG